MQFKTRRSNIVFGVLSMAVGLSFFVGLQFQVFAIARGYTSSDAGLQTGMVVALSLADSTDSTVERASQENSDRVVGIVTTVEASLVSSGSQSSSVLVESEGQVDAYVSDINGVISQGDLLVLSPLKGILMKAGNVSGKIFAIAAAPPTATTPYSYQEGSSAHETQIAKTRVSLNNQGSNSATGSSNSALAKLGRSIVGKEVSETRVLLAIILFIIVLIAEGGIIYGAISSAITALGRNPLARRIIRGELLRVAAVALAVLLVGLGAVYVILWV